MSTVPYEGHQWSRARKNYAFLRQAEQERRPFTLQELHEATGYSLKTINKYRRRLWKPFLRPLSTGQFMCMGLQECSWEAFAELHAFLSRDLVIDYVPPLLTNEEEERPQLPEAHPSGSNARQVIAGFLMMLAEKIGGSAVWNSHKN